MLFSFPYVFAQQIGSTANAGILTMIYGQQFEYATPAYQLRNPSIYFSNNNGETIHRITDNVHLALFSIR